MSEPGGGGAVEAAASQFSRSLGPGGRRRCVRGRGGMRSEKEGVGGSGVAVAARSQSGRERTSAAEVHVPRESPRREAGAPPALSSSGAGSAGKPREEKKTVLSKVGATRSRAGWRGWGSCRRGGASKVGRRVQSPAGGRGKDAGWAERGWALPPSLPEAEGFSEMGRERTGWCEPAPWEDWS